MRFKLSEIGKRNSTSDQKMLQTMHDNAVSLGAACGTQESDRDPVVVIRDGVDAICTEAGMSYGDITDLIRTALRAQYTGAGIWVYPRDVFPDSVVYSVSNNDDSINKLYQRPYTLTGGTVTFSGDPTEVHVVTTYEPVNAPVAEAADLTGDLVPLTEKAVAKDGSVNICLITPGQGSSGYYPAEVLKRDGPTQFKANMHMFIDHPTVAEEANHPERSITKIAGTLTSDAVWDENGAAGPGLYAKAQLRSDVAPLIEELAPHIGVSIRALGKAGTRTIEGKKVRTIESIDQAKSADFVTVAGRGGRVIDLIESARQRQPGGTPPKEPTTVDKETADKLSADLAEAQATIKAQGTTIAKLQETNVLREARAFVTEKLAASGLPKLTRERLTGDLTANAAIKEGSLDTDALATAIETAVKEAATELAEANGGNPVRGMGAPLTEARKPEETKQRLGAALGRLMGDAKLGEAAATGR